MEADLILKEIEELTQHQHLPIIGPVKGKYLAETVRKFKVKTVLEVGTLIGYSAILIAKNLPDDGKLTTIEIHPDEAKTAVENVRRAKLSHKIEVVVGNAIDLIPPQPGPFDMVFLDAAKQEYYQYLKLAEDKLKTGGVVFADNVKMFAGEMQEFLDYVRKSGKYRSEFIDVGFDGVEISEKLR